MQRKEIPNYPTDLNAIHKAILDGIIQGPDIIENYSNEALFNDEINKIADREGVYVWHLGAKEYCEAFIKSIHRISVYG